ncbi:MAG TPA: MFS transporter [Terracidiphilus sp.]|nr:MFS transporter [Terracidiphilus sp.]
MSSPAACSEATVARHRAGVPAFLATWWPADALGRPFWTFFAAAFFFDFGVGLYFFLFNLFLLNLHFDERAMGLVTGALTLGNVVGTLPISIVARRVGLQKALLICFIVAPLLGIARTSILWMPAQIGLAFLMGSALSAWPVCFAPAVARLTTERNRVFAFSIAFATGIGTGILAGVFGGRLPGMLRPVHAIDSLAFGIRLTLIGAALIAMLGILPISRLKLGRHEEIQSDHAPASSPFLMRFLAAFAVWNVVTGAFIPFAPVYFQKRMGLSLQQVGEMFSASQLAQFASALAAPLIYRRAGSLRGIIWLQVMTAVAVFALGGSHGVSGAIACYVLYTAVQFSAGPGLYSMLMSRLPEAARNNASALQNVTGALAQAAAAALTGMLVVRYGYKLIFAGDGVTALFAALLVFLLLARNEDPKSFAAAD